MIPTPEAPLLMLLIALMENTAHRCTIRAPGEDLTQLRSIRNRSSCVNESDVWMMMTTVNTVRNTKFAMRKMSSL
jgi:hypothetical protein